MNPTVYYVVGAIIVAWVLCGAIGVFLINPESLPRTWKAKTVSTSILLALFGGAGLLFVMLCPSRRSRP